VCRVGGKGWECGAIGVNVVVVAIVKAEAELPHSKERSDRYIKNWKKMAEFDSVGSGH